MKQILVVHDNSFSLQKNAKKAPIGMGGNVSLGVRMVLYAKFSVNRF
jgi:hypothetical protein